MVAEAGQSQFKDIAAKFHLPGRYLHAERIGQGHINDTFMLTVEDGKSDKGHRRFVLQRLNDSVFTNPEAVMENIMRVTTHLQSKSHLLRGKALPVLKVIMTIDGQHLYRDSGNSVWRMYNFVEATRALSGPATKAQARSAARAYGRFQADLADLPGSRLHETITDFHNTPRRTRALADAVDADPLNRAAKSKTLIDQAAKLAHWDNHLLEAHARGILQERVVHNDTKLNNVLFDRFSDDAVCVVDLDTVMPGLAAFDFGDLVRSAVPSHAEDQVARNGSRLNTGIFTALAAGYVEGADSVLTHSEKAYLAPAAVVMSYEVGIRFLTDFLNGDHYFKIHHPLQNLERAASQLTTALALEAQLDELRDIVNSL